MMGRIRIKDMYELLSLFIILNLCVKKKISRFFTLILMKCKYVYYLNCTKCTLYFNLFHIKYSYSVDNFLLNCYKNILSNRHATQTIYTRNYLHCIWSGIADTCNRHDKIINYIGSTKMYVTVITY